MTDGTAFDSGVPWTGARTPDTGFLLEDLTEPQRAAVLHARGPLLILAAAGSGKTRVITRRIAYLIAQGVPAWSILALTFTNKAAGEMRERVTSLLERSYGPDSRAARALTVTTFHSLCARLLRRHAQAAGLRDDFTIYDTNDQSVLCKRAIEELQLSTSNFPVRGVLSQISTAKNQLLDDEAFAARATDFSTRNIAKIYRGYTRALRGANAVDFDDLLLLTAEALRRDEGIREECRRRWRYVLVDEYQDTNHAQFLIASHIAGPGDGQGPNFCVVGDPDQSIYGWRGADIGNILDFEQNYPGCRVITLGENFRSTAPILRVADALIRTNKRRKHKDLFTSRGGGEKPEAVLCRNQAHEGSLVADWLRRRHEQGVAWRDMAIFYRTNALSRVMEDVLRQTGVPYTIARGTAFYEREEVRHALAYLRVIANPDDAVSLSRIINVPARAIGAATVERIERQGALTGLGPFAALREPDAIPDLTPRARTGIRKFVEMVDGWTGGGTFMGSRVDCSLADLVNRVIIDSGLRTMYANQASTSKTEADAERVDNLDELVSSARQFEQEYDPSADPSAERADYAATEATRTPPLLAVLRAFLESVALVADADAVDPAQGSVTLMTLHAAKGLEFDSVAMIGLEEGLLPHSRAIGFGSTDDAMEEERRLCFVGITRAMRRLLMTAAKYRTLRGMEDRTIPSRFLGEIPSSELAVSDQSDFDSDERDQSPAPRGGGQRTPDPFPVGSTVRHPQFGIGTVQSVTAGSRVTVRFRDAGIKTLVLEYARLTRVS